MIQDFRPEMIGEENATRCIFIKLLSKLCL